MPTALMGPAILRGPHRPDLLRDECLADIRELKAAGDAVAGALTRRGATPGQVVGLLLPRGADVLIAQAGITKSGAAWLPLDPEWPFERIQTCLQSASAIGLVSCREWVRRVASLAVPVWTIEDLRAEPGVSSSTRNAQPSDPAYVMFTSGSTGQPKGIVVSQRSICHLLRSENEVLRIRAGDRVYQGLSIAFDMSFEEIWISYLVGAALWIAPAEVARDPDAMAQALTRERISVLHAVPTLVGLTHDPLPTVRLINLGGEACPQPIADRLAQPGRRVFNSYGPTETIVSATLAELTAGVPVSIGTPLPNYGVLVVDEHQRPQPMDTVGELCVFGPGLAVGYLGRAELTGERFVVNPIAAAPDESRMYRTGDLARIEAGGSVYWVGRSDYQVKVRGFRVELNEIAAVLNEHPSVSAAAVIVRQIAGADELVAFIVAGDGARSCPPTLRPSLVSRLPSYMIPAHIEVVPELPRLPSGKLNADALRSMALTSVGEHVAGHAQPRSENEGALYDAIRTLCPGCAITHDADFFDDLGGHSLLVARLVSLLRRTPRYAALSVQDVYRARRLAAIALAMGRCATADAERSRSHQGRAAPVGRAVVSSFGCGVVWRRPPPRRSSCCCTCWTGSRRSLSTTISLETKATMWR